MAFSDRKLYEAEQTMPAISKESYAFLQQWIQRESGIVIDREKTYLLQSRLTPIIEKEKLGSMEVLCGKLRGNSPGFARQVIEAMTTNETLFFRDKTPFETLRTDMIPKLLASRPKGQKLALWSAAASSGQEAYSMAMLLLDMGLNSYEVDIFGSDLSDEVLDRARAGLYNKFEVSRGLPPGYLERYFQPRGAEFQINEEVRKMVRFRQLDLRSSLRGHGPFHVIFCRNVLIYFDQPCKANIMSEIRHAMFQGGYLVLGAGETATQVIPTLERKAVGQSVAYVAV